MGRGLNISQLWRSAYGPGCVQPVKWFWLKLMPVLCWPVKWQHITKIQ